MQVSIIMPYYNAAAYIRETVEAIIAQTYNYGSLILWSNKILLYRKILL